MASSSVISSIADHGEFSASFASSSSSEGLDADVWNLRISIADGRASPRAPVHSPWVSSAASDGPGPGQSSTKSPSSRTAPAGDAAELPAVSRPVQRWLGELRWHTEPECSHILQSKSILARAPAPEEQPVYSVSARAAIEVISQRSSLISGEFRKVFKFVGHARLKDLNAYVSGLTAHIRALLHSISSMGLLNNPQLAKTELSLKKYCVKLEETTKSFLAKNGRLPTVEPLTRELTRVAHAFTRLVDSVLGELVHLLISGLSHALGPVPALRDIIHLAMRFDHLAGIVSRMGGLTMMIDLCRDVTLQHHWSISLRAISAVCCIPEAVLRFQEDRGLDLLRILLCDSGLPESVRCEAAGVVAQITSPCLCSTQGAHPLGSSLRPLIDDFVRSLTMLSVEAAHPDVFLLSAAALANLTFLEPSVYDALLRYHTVRALVDACQLNKADSVFARDQVATLFANMAVCTSCHDEITSLNGVELLLQFLAECPTDCRSVNEREACARLQQKAAIALGRLSSNPGNAQIVIECDGLRRLATLCRQQEERAGSDAVLVAALAALRKIHMACGSEDFDEEDLRQLIEPKMIDAFLACSKMEESFV